METIYEMPKTTTNNLKDIIDWLNCGKNIVVIANDYGKWRLFHREKDGLCGDLSCYRISIIRCKTFPGLLDDGEWNWYITREGNIEFNSQEVADKINKAYFVDKTKNVFYFIA